MAKLVDDAALRDEIETLLAYLLAEWEAVPGLRAQWADWSEYERLDFAQDWPIREDRLARLSTLAGTRELSPDQQGRYRRVASLVQQHRPLLDDLFRSAGLQGSATRVTPATLA
jgi:hypothetical protein